MRRVASDAGTSHVRHAAASLATVMSDFELELLVNGTTRTVPDACTVSRLLEDLGLTTRRVAVAVNRDVVPRSTFTTHRLTAGDRVEILEAVGGG
jgi:sulfur carrier protein